MTTKYNIADPISIEKYAKTLLNKSLTHVLGSKAKQTYSGKGRLGQLLEDLFFEYRPNSNSEADFREAGVELKTTPIKKVSRGYVSKERLVFNIINFNEEYKTDFVNSSFWKKNRLLLLMFYLHDPSKSDLELIFKIIRLWQFPAIDLKIIKDDWEKIVGAIKMGKAHELSEGDTIFLGACTKGANKKSLRSQPFSEIPAMQRAFSLKSKYLNFIIEKSLKNEPVYIDHGQYDKILRDSNIFEDSGAKYHRLNLDELEPVVKSVHEFLPGETFEDFVIKKFTPFVGKSIAEISTSLHSPVSDSKQKLYVLAKNILGVSKKRIEEFEKAEIVMKTIKEEFSGSLKESMSFAQIKFKEIEDEEWMESYWFRMLTKRFFFIIFRKDKEGELRLRKVQFWTMPAKDLQIARMFWEDTKNKILSNNFSDFMKISDNSICHVRPKGVNSKDLMETSHGTFEKKKSYWLNSTYIKAVIQNE